MERTDTALLFLQRSARTCWNACISAIDDSVPEAERTLLEAAKKAAGLVDEHLADAYVPNAYGLQPKE